MLCSLLCYCLGCRAIFQVFVLFTFCHFQVYSIDIDKQIPIEYHRLIRSSTSLTSEDLHEDHMLQILEETKLKKDIRANTEKMRITEKLE